MEEQRSGKGLLARIGGTVLLVAIITAISFAFEPAERKQMRALDRQIKALAVTLDQRKAEYDQTDARLEEISQKIEAYAAKLTATEDRLGPRADQDKQYLADIEGHDRLVDEYNTLQKEFKAKVAVYEKDIDAHNALVDQYNQLEDKVGPPRRGLMRLLPF